MKKDKMNVLFHCINVNVIAQNAGVFVGTNTQLNWNSIVKMNTGAGNVVGSRNFSLYNKNVLYDNDVVDTYYRQNQYNDDDSFPSESSEQNEPPSFTETAPPLEEEDSSS
ncbi:hypothetical protein A374_10118 [Fictibacillus macauensis ZFHKF-1]|uniref:Spore germination protein gerPA/gerPF n=1 Tax=Fictibacillus macauensis ZFHKF-1 TaxID=1196324 RepID=I8UFJ6_9BACL|nr:hypothetical protein [Fictibacillus macauensis]EIT85583.1 hypothetical protein A374_10118 [Fictibacillus macauensis ZFHKF-1]